MRAARSLKEYTYAKKALMQFEESSLFARESLVPIDLQHEKLCYV